MRKPRSFSISLLLALASFIGLLIVAYRYVHILKEVMDGGRAKIARSVSEATLKIDGELNTLVPVSISISEDITAGKLPLDDAAIIARLELAKRENPNLFGVGVAFIPGGFHGKDRYAPLLVNSEGVPVLTRIEDVYDYTEPAYDWYHRPLKEGPVWQEPHYGKASKSFLANFTAPFFGKDRNQPQGVVFTSMSLDQYQELVGSQGFGATGFGFLLSGRGAFVSHPNESYVTENKTFADWIGKTDDSKLQNLVRSALAGVRAFAERTDPLTGKDQWVFVEPVVSTGWVMGVVFDVEHLPGLQRVTSSRLLVLAVAAVFALALLGMVLAHRKSSVIQPS